MLCLAACSPPSTEIASNRDSNYSREPKRLAVVENVRDPLVLQSKSFQDAFQQKIKNCGIVGGYVVRPVEEFDAARPPHDDVRQDIDAKTNDFVRSFNPDTVLTITEAGFRRKAEMANGHVAFSSYEKIEYNLALTDTQTRKVVWKSHIVLNPGVGTEDVPGTQLATDIVARLTKDGIFRSCPAGR